MAKASKIEPVNIELYQKAWARFRRDVNVVAKSPKQRRLRKKTSRKKKKGRKRKTKKTRASGLFAILISSLQT
jgi:hypothetical protein